MFRSISQLEEALYEQVAGEIATGDIRQGLWLKATVESGGSEHQAKVLYTKFRISQILEESARSADLARQREAAAIDAERNVLISRLRSKNYAVEEKKEGAWVLFEPSGDCRRFESFSALAGYASTLVPVLDHTLSR